MECYRENAGSGTRDLHSEPRPALAVLAWLCPSWPSPGMTRAELPHPTSPPAHPEGQSTSPLLGDPKAHSQAPGSMVCVC